MLILQQCKMCKCAEDWETTNIKQIHMHFHYKYMHDESKEISGFVDCGFSGTYPFNQTWLFHTHIFVLDTFL